MRSIFSLFLLSAEDVGIKKYSLEEIAKRMEPTEDYEQESLKEFGCAVSEIFEGESCKKKEA